MIIIMQLPEQRKLRAKKSHKEKPTNTFCAFRQSGHRIQNIYRFKLHGVLKCIGKIQKPFSFLSPVSCSKILKFFVLYT